MSERQEVAKRLREVSGEFYAGEPKELMREAAHLLEGPTCNHSQGLQVEDAKQLREIARWIAKQTAAGSAHPLVATLRSLADRIQNCTGTDTPSHQDVLSVVDQIEPPEYVETDFGKGTSLLAAYRAGYFDAKQDARAAMGHRPLVDRPAWAIYEPPPAMTDPPKADQ